ncbi:helix-turn-helix domain-containing protein [Pseudobutyrivibrio xylanivorans]|uniref:Helix-turn-helix domain-containing protein n=1 Tax=Pseudobutyrivibrio xylanivorans TaxID=185007 RepID=A0A5P6VT18_PSEXY|nr:helix-turn-helix domain-containing protein [Pseudobutyrivibrio xylanivorans]QFJ54344.1 helix-turn-helix domain-containing protein [Pseudobutyrivibrio xylanivorans]
MTGDNLLPQKLKELRKAHSYTQDYVAATLGIVRQTYSHYETGKRTPSTENLYKLAGLYRISIDDLMHIVINIDRNTYYEAPSPSDTSLELNDYLEYVNSPVNANKLHNLSSLEKELLFYFQKISEEDKKEIIEFTKIKAHRQ